jgi:hypothetical protein
MQNARKFIGVSEVSLFFCFFLRPSSAHGPKPNNFFL